jgi:RNA polymerase primary sigma factor
MNQYANDFTETVQAYYNDLRPYRPLSKAKEKKLLKLCSKGDLDAKNKILESNLKFVFDIAKRYSGRGVPIGELISEGNMGLIKAIDKYDCNRDVKFISYAVWWIRQYMLEAIKKRKLHRFVEIDSKDGPSGIIERVVPDEEDEYVTEYDARYSNEGEERKRELTENQRRTLSKLMGVLNERERFVVEGYYGINGRKELTLSEMGSKMGISSERVRQVKITAIRKLRSQAMLFDDVTDIF